MAANTHTHLTMSAANHLTAAADTLATVIEQLTRAAESAEGEQRKPLASAIAWLRDDLRSSARRLKNQTTVARSVDD